MAFGGGVVLPGVLQWLSSIAWDALAALFGAEALTLLLGIPFWVAALIALGAQGVVGFFGYHQQLIDASRLRVVHDIRGVRG